MENETCKWKHLGGAVIASCNDRWVTPYHYGDLSTVNWGVFLLMSYFKFCPFCGKPIELPKWLNEQWRNDLPKLLEKLKKSGEIQR